MKVSEKIKDEYKNWESGDIISIASGTGSGKSYFVQNILAEFAQHNNEQILYLVSRVRLKDQIQENLKNNKITNINVIMYQQLENMWEKDESIEWLNNYKYIVCDESHYFLNDSSFNDKTNISLTHILSAINATVLLLSATGDMLISYIEHFYKDRKLIKYTLEHDYRYIKTLEAYNSEQYLYKAMDWLLENNHKTIIFLQSDTKAYELFKKYESHSMFVCGVNSKYRKDVDSNKLDSIIKKERFDTLFLIATSALDVGVNIKDTEVQHIIIDMLDTDTFIQCLGRKRLSENVEENVSVMFRNYTNQQLGGYIVYEAERVEQGKCFYKKEKSLKKYSKVSDIFYFDEKSELQVNNMKYVKSSVNLTRYERYVQKTNGYLEEIKSLLQYQNEISIHDYLQDITAKLAILEAHADTKFYSSIEAKKVLKKLKLINSKSKKEVKSFSIANRELAAQGYPYKFVESKEYIVDSEGQKKQSRVYTISLDKTV